MEARVRLVPEYEQGEATMTELCRAYEVSRETEYYWLRRYRGGGVESLRDLGRAPERHPNQTAAEVERQVLELRRAHMRGGPRKLKRVLELESPEQRWPAASTMGEMLRREGLAVLRAKRPRTPANTQPFAAADAPNRRAQPLFVALPGGGKGGSRAGAGDLRSGISRVWNAGSGLNCQASPRLYRWNKSKPQPGEREGSRSRLTVGVRFFFLCSAMHNAPGYVVRDSQRSFAPPGGQGRPPLHGVWHIIEGQKRRIRWAHPPMRNWQAFRR
jgi:transposase-like protein